MVHLGMKGSTWMPSESNKRMAILQGTLDLIVLWTLQTVGKQHAYAIATRLQQISGDLLQLNQGTLYPALVRLEQQRRIRGIWGKTESKIARRWHAVRKATQAEPIVALRTE